VRSLKDEVVQSSVEGVYVEEDEVGGELKENGDRSQFLFNLMPDPVVIVDSKGRFLAVNDRVEEKTGFKRKELLGKNFLKTKIVTAKSKVILMNNLTKRMEGTHPALYEVEALTKDGGKIPVEVNAVKIEYEGKPADLRILRDITERKTVKQTLKESEEKFRNLAEQSPSMIFINKKGKVVYANKKCEEIMGYKKEEFYSPDFNFFSLIAPEFMDMLKLSFSRHMKGEEVAPLEYALITKEGRRIEAILSTKLIRYGGDSAILGTVTDITERRRIEEALKSARQEKVTILNSLMEHVIHQDRTMKILWANQAACESAGLSLDELIGRHCYEIWPKRSTPCPDCPVMKATETGQPQEVEKTTPDGRSWFIRGYPVLDPNGQIAGGIEVTLETTERKRTDEKLRKSEEDLRESLNRLDLILSTMEDGVDIVTYDYVIRYQNKLLKDRFGDLTGKKCYVEYMGLEKPCSFCPMRKAIKYKKTFRAELTAKDGRDYEIISTPLEHPDGHVDALEIVRDITERKKAGMERKHYEERLSVMHRYAQSLNMAENIEEIHTMTLNAVETILGFKHAAFMMIEGKTLRLIARRGYQKSLDISLPLDGVKGVTVKAVRTGKTVLVPDVRKEKLYVDTAEKNL